MLRIIDPRHEWGRRALVVTWTLFAATSCDRQPNEVVHPTPENLPPPGSPVIQPEGTPTGLDSAALAAWSSVRDDLLSDWEVSAALGQVGDIGDNAPDVFGIETDLVVDGDDIVILDRRNHAVKIFGRDGGYRGGFGRAGPGPGEFRDPVAIELLAAGHLAVLDRGREIKIYSPSDSGYVYTETHHMELVPEGMCAVEDRVFVSGWRQDDETMIHELPLTDAGTPQRFGRGYQGDHWLIQDQMSDGPIGCVGDPLRVILAFARLPVVRAYTVNGGALTWTSRNEDYLQPPVLELRATNGQPRVRFSNRGPRDMVVSLTTVSNRHVLLQNVRFEPMPPPADVQLEVRSYLIDAATGQGALISDSLPLVGAVGHDYYVAKWLLPFPRIEIRELK